MTNTANRKGDQPLDIDRLIGGLGDATIGPEHLCILGGVLDAGPTAVDGLLACFGSVALGYGLWNHSDGMALTAYSPGSTAPAAVAPLERVRLFGAPKSPAAKGLPGSGGDLEIRRDGPRLRWRFVGAPAPGLVDTLVRGGLGFLDFWQRHPGVRLGMREQRVLLWGRRDAATGLWSDDRVAAARLAYPVAADPERVALAYLEFTEAGAPAFVWWQGLAGGNEP